MIVYQLIQRIELYHPEEILAGTVSKHLEVLHIISKSKKKGKNIPDVLTALIFLPGKEYSFLYLLAHLQGKSSAKGYAHWGFEDF